MRILVVALLLALSSEVVAHARERECSYQISEIALRDGKATIYGAALDGRIVGYRTDAGRREAIVVHGRMSSYLGTLNGVIGSSYATDINEHGVIVGASTFAAGDSREHAFVYQNWSMTDIGTLGGEYSVATAINSRGVIVGGAEPLSGQYYHPFVYRDGVMLDLGTFGGPFGVAEDVNDAGVVVGHAETVSRISQPFIFEGGIMKRLPLLTSSPYASGAATAINRSGIVVGRSWAGEADHAVRWVKGIVEDLGTLGGLNSSALALNSAGEIVGVSDFEGRVDPFLHDGHQMINLSERSEPPRESRRLRCVSYAAMGNSES